MSGETAEPSGSGHPRTHGSTRAAALAALDPPRKARSRQVLSRVEPLPWGSEGGGCPRGRDTGREAGLRGPVRRPPTPGCGEHRPADAEELRNLLDELIEV